MTAPAWIRENRNVDAFVSLLAIARRLGAEVRYVAPGRTVSISAPAPVIDELHAIAEHLADVGAVFGVGRFLASVKG